MCDIQIKSPIWNQISMRFANYWEAQALRWVNRNRRTIQKRTSPDSSLIRIFSIKSLVDFVQTTCTTRWMYSRCQSTAVTRSPLKHPCYTSSFTLGYVHSLLIYADLGQLMYYVLSFRLKSCRMNKQLCVKLWTSSFQTTGYLASTWAVWLWIWPKRGSRTKRRAVH